MTTGACDDVAGVLLAGGQARRMGGGDKCLQMLGDRPVLAHVIDRIRPQVGALMLNANGDPARFDAFGLPVCADVIGGFAGPLAGVLTGMDWAATAAPQRRWILTVPTDAPFLPRDLVKRLHECVQAGSVLARAGSAGRAHPVVGLWPVALRSDLRTALIEEGIRKVDQWTARFSLTDVSYPDRPLDPFFNMNQPEDLETARKLLISGSFRPVAGC